MPDLDDAADLIKAVKGIDAFDQARKAVKEVAPKFKVKGSITDTVNARKKSAIHNMYKESNDVLEAFEKNTGGDVGKVLGKKLGIKPEDVTQEAIKENYMKKIQEEQLRDTNLGDRMVHYKVPQRAAAAGGTAWLVSSLSSSTGPQTNAQLYGQQGSQGY